MTNAEDILQRLDGLLEGTGMFVRGGFHPIRSDWVHELTDGRPARTAVLVGNAGGALWEAFDAARSANPNSFDPRHPLDGWVRQKGEVASTEVGAEPIFPNDGPPFVPIIDWAKRAEPIYRSPIGIMIHPESGLWHVYRAVLLFSQRIDLPAPVGTPTPCDSCDKRPCLNVCPVDAFEPGRFAAQRCGDHVASPAGAACRERGCLARRACPIGPELHYPRAAQAFHTEAMVGAVRRGFGARN